jgi:hypothetical protein
MSQDYYLEKTQYGCKIRYIKLIFRSEGIFQKTAPEKVKPKNNFSLDLNFLEKSFS